MELKEILNLYKNMQIHQYLDWKITEKVKIVVRTIVKVKIKVNKLLWVFSKVE